MKVENSVEIEVAYSTERLAELKNQSSGRYGLMTFLDKFFS
jgi:hypothetical protein